MIGKITGKLIEKLPPQVMLEAAGVGYEIEVSMQTFCMLPPLNETASLFTQLIVREDAHLLFGFISKEERTTFRQLIKVSGVGAKTALGILSALSIDELALAIANEDIKRLSTIPGIGKKSAERLILELRGKLHLSDHGLFASPENTQKQSAINDIISGLIALGYNEKDATAATKNLPENTDVGEGIRLALKNMLK